MEKFTKKRVLIKISLSFSVSLFVKSKLICFPSAIFKIVNPCFLGIINKKRKNLGKYISKFSLWSHITFPFLVVNVFLYTHSALLNLFSNFPRNPVWGWHTPYFPGNSASNSLNLKVEERGINETQPLPHTLSLS